jgi:hypothetical protein
VVPLNGLKDDGACTCKRGMECAPKNRGKHPFYTGWVQRATDDFAAVEKDLKGGHNIGLAMGHGLVALDVDGEDGRRVLAKLITDHPGLWPDGPTAETGSGSLHFVFATTESFKNAVKLFDGGAGGGIDVRSEGGQIVACPSNHRSGRRYRWVELSPGVSSFDLEVPQLPEFLAEIMRGTAHITFDIQAWLSTAEPSIQGENGSAALMRVAHKLVRAGQCRTVERFLQVIEPWNKRCKPDWSEKELEHAFDNAFGKFRTEATVELPTDKNGQVICTRVHLDQIVRADPQYEGQLRWNVRLMETAFK